MVEQPTNDPNTDKRPPRKSTTGPARNLLLATAAVPVAVMRAEIEEVKFKSSAINGRLVDGPSTTTTSAKYVKKIMAATSRGLGPGDRDSVIILVTE
jgi:hypothetical protein